MLHRVKFLVHVDFIVKALRDPGDLGWGGVEGVCVGGCYVLLLARHRHDDGAVSSGPPPPSREKCVRKAGRRWVGGVALSMNNMNVPNWINVSVLYGDAASGVTAL